MTNQPGEEASLAKCACGGEACLFRNRQRFRYRCQTLHCFCSTPWYLTRSEAIAAWNRMQGADDEYARGVKDAAMICADRSEAITDEGDAGEIFVLRQCVQDILALLNPPAGEAARGGNNVHP